MYVKFFLTLIVAAPPKCGFPLIKPEKKCAEILKVLINIMCLQ